MAKIEFYKAKDSDWIPATPPEGQTESEGATRPRHAGSGADPQMLEVRGRPNLQAKIHAHETGEFFYIVKGEMHFGQHVLKPGDSVYIPGLILYSFRAGPEGVQFLNFRPRRDLSHFWPDDIKTLKALPDEERSVFIADNVEKTKAYYGMVD